MPVDFSKLPGVIKFFTPQELTDEFVNVVVESPSHFRYWLPTTVTIDYPRYDVPHDGRFWRVDYWVVDGQVLSIQELKSRNITGRDRVMLMEVYRNEGDEDHPKHRLAGYVLTTDVRGVTRALYGDDGNG